MILKTLKAEFCSQDRVIIFNFMNINSKNAKAISTTFFKGSASKIHDIFLHNEMSFIYSS